MCFCKTKTVKSLRANNCIVNDINNIELGYNSIDNCEYIDYDSVGNIKTSQKDLRVVQINTRGIKSKLDELDTLISDLKDPDIIIISETWLKKGEENFIKIKGYKFEGIPREHKKGGGVGFLIKKGLIYREMTSLNKNNSDPTFEHFYLELKGDRNNIILGSIYRPPNTNLDKFMAEYKNSLEQLTKLKNKEIILGMDHNINLLRHDVYPRTQDFIELNLDMNLLPVITKPIRVTSTSVTLIDNIFVSNKLQHCINAGVIVTDLSDHFPCILTVTHFNQSNTNQTKIIKRKLNKKNLDKIKNDIGNIDWEIELNNLDTNKSFENLHNKLKEIIDLHAPERLIYLKEKRINKPWISKNLANCKRKSKILFKNSLMNPGTKSHYTDYSKILKRTTRIAKLNYYKSLCKDFKSNTKKLWAMVNNQIKKTDNKTSIITKLVSNNKEYTNSKNIGDVLAKHFATVGKTYASKIKPSKKSLKHYCNKIPLNNKSLYFNPTSELEINKIINKLENKNSYGYDQISNKLIKELCLVISHPLTIVFNKSLEEGKFPELMKQADTIPLYKTKSTEDCNNYQPISLLLTMSKILEKLVYSRTVSYLDIINCSTRVNTVSEKIIHAVMLLWN